MTKRLILSLLTIININFISAGRSGFGEGFGIGAVTGLAGGLIASKIAEPRPRPVYHQTVIVEDPYACQKRDELRIREQNIRHAEREAELERRRIAREKEIQKRKKIRKMIEEEAMLDQEEDNHRFIIQDTVIKTETVNNSNSKNLELELLKEKKELLKEENRKKELEIKEKELEIKLLKAKNEAKKSDTSTYINQDNNTKTVIKTVSHKTKLQPKYIIG